MPPGSNKPAPRTVKTKKLWIPGRSPPDAAAASDTAAPNTAAGGSRDAADDKDVDELDLLTSQYAEEAEASTRDVMTRTDQRSASQKGMRELRSEGLVTELSTENKCASKCTPQLP